MTANTDTGTFSHNIAGAVRAEFGRQGKQRTELATVLGVSRPTAYSRYNGNTPFTAEELDKVASFLNISAFDLVESAGLAARFTGRTSDSVTAALPPVDPFAQPARSKRAKKR